LSWDFVLQRGGGGKIGKEAVPGAVRLDRVCLRTALRSAHLISPVKSAPNESSCCAAQRGHLFPRRRSGKTFVATIIAGQGGSRQRCRPRSRRRWCGRSVHSHPSRDLSNGLGIHGDRPVPFWTPLAPGNQSAATLCTDTHCGKGSVTRPSCVLFPLTLTLSLRERESPRLRSDSLNALSLRDASEPPVGRKANKKGAGDTQRLESKVCSPN